MPVSSARSIVLRSPPFGYGILRRPLRWPVAQPTDDLDYSFDLTAPLADASDGIASASISIKPSGVGELQAIQLIVVGSVVTAELAGGVAGRDYVAQLAVGSTWGRSFVYLASLMIDPALASYPLPAPPSEGFGMPINWTGSVFPAVVAGLTATGTGQSTALPLPGVVSIFTSVPAGTGGILSALVVNGTVVVQNDTANDLLIYPPIGAQIGALGVNVPFIVSANSRVSFSTAGATTQWYAA